MKKKLIMTALLVVLFPFSVNACEKLAGSISFMVGEVMVKSGEGEFVRADFKMNLFAGDILETEDESSCEITMTDGSVIRMDAKSTLEVKIADFSEKGRKISIFARAGRLWFAARKAISRNDEFGVSTDKAVCAVRGTAFAVDAGNKATEISVYSGKVATWAAIKAIKPPPSLSSAGASLAPTPLKAPSEVAGPVRISGPHPVTANEWVAIISAMQRIRIGNKGGYSISDIKKEKMDAWVKWNIERDKKTKQ